MRENQQTMTIGLYCTIHGHVDKEDFREKSLQEKSLAKIFEKNRGKRNRYLPEIFKRNHCNRNRLQRFLRKIISTIDNRDFQEELY